MLDINNMKNEDILKQQYKNTESLSTRKSLHEKYSVNKVGFLPWLLNQYQFSPKCRVLELGSGKGDLWKTFFGGLHSNENSIEIILSDFSDGMVDYLQNTYKEEKVTIKKINIQSIPYSDNSFDIVIANSILYHVPDIDKSLAEVKRVLKKDGIFYAATFGINGISSYIHDSLNKIGVKMTNNINIAFTLQNGIGILVKYFRCVKRLDYEDHLEITNIKDFINYISSMSSMAELDPIYLSKLDELFQSKVDKNGILYIPKEYGTFISFK